MKEDRDPLTGFPPEGVCAGTDPPSPALRLVASTRFRSFPVGNRGSCLPERAGGAVSGCPDEVPPGAGPWLRFSCQAPFAERGKVRDPPGEPPGMRRVDATTVRDPPVGRGLQGRVSWEDSLLGLRSVPGP